MPKINEILERLITTEKTTKAKEDQNKYTFRVKNDASQGLVAVEVARTYKVEVVNVNLMVIPGKKRRLSKTNRFIRLPKWKKAIVELKEGQKIVVAKATEEDKDKDKKKKESNDKKL
ncbi:MAG: 50S ribosomal protein L23 [Patescibacteria group bacterium]